MRQLRTIPDEAAESKIMSVGALRSIPPRWRARMDRAAAKDGARESLLASIREAGLTAAVESMWSSNAEQD